MSDATEPRTPTVLIVDDEPTLTDAVSYTLRKEGFNVAVAATGIDAIRMARREKPDAIVLDVMLPGIDGLQVCRTLRAESTVPILLLSAKGEEIDRVIGLEMGADDYLGKPFAMRELLARIRAMLRRVDMMTSVPAGVAAGATLPVAPASLEASPRVPEHIEDSVASGEIVVDRARRTVTIAGAPLALRPKEFDLLYFMVKHPGVVHSRKVLLQHVWGYDYPIDTRTVDVHMRWLRQKIERDPMKPSRLETVRGFGYRLTVGSDQQG